MDKVIISKGYNSLTGECSSELDTLPVSQIIDGVDVSGCDSYSYNHNELMPYGDVKITEHYCYHVNRECNGKDCDYKQLKRLAQENEELKQENERLKTNKGRCAFKCLDNTFCPEADKKITELELSRDSYKVNYETAKKYREKAEKALQEIRDIVDKAYYTEDYMLGQRFTELVDAINLTITNIGAE